MNQPIQSSSLNPLVYQTLTHQASILPALNCPRASLIAQMVKNSPATQETPVRSGKITGEGIGYPVQYSGLENSMDCTVHWVAKSQTRLSNFHFHFTMFHKITFR